MSDLVEQIEALLALNAKGAVSHRVPGLAVELLERAAATLTAGAVKAEPVAWRVFNPMVQEDDELSHFYFEDKSSACAEGDTHDMAVEALYATPMPVAITDEMVERAYAEFMADKGSGPDGRTTRQTLRDTLYAALASKPEGEL